MLRGMKNIEATDLEFYGWLCAILGMCIPPVIIFIMLNVIAPAMKNKWAVAFYLGWIPGNLISCWYLSYSVGGADAFMLFFFTQIIQLVFVIIAAKILGKFGQRE
jgi:hypothetical protein